MAETAFESIVEPNRRAILSLLAAASQSVGEIARQLDMPQLTSAYLRKVVSFVIVLKEEKNLALSHLHLTHLNRLSLASQLGSFHAELYSWGEVGREWWQRYGWRNQLHMHSFFEVTYVHKGQGCFHVHDQEQALQPGSLFVARPTELHEIRSSQESPLEISFWSYSMTLSQSRTTLDPQGIYTLLETFLSSPCWVKSGCEEIEATLQLLAAEVTQRAPGYLVAIEGLLTKLLLDSARAVTPLAWQALDASEYDERFALVQQMVRYLHDNYSRPLRLDDLAGYVHLSKRHATRLFEREMETSIGKYLTAYRLKQATSLLSNHHLLIKEVAQACGYSDAQHFANVFHHTFGCSPLQFRQQQRRAQEAPFSSAPEA